jgi:hypothetical protein
MHPIRANQSHSSAGFLISPRFLAKKPQFSLKAGVFYIFKSINNVKNPTNKHQISA